MPIIDIIPGVKVYQEEKFSILFGCPPEIIKHFMIQKVPFPDYVVLPDTVYQNEVLQNSTEFVLYYHLFILQNFFKGKKLNILGEAQHVINNRELLRLTLLGPTQEEFNFLDTGKTPNPHFKELYKESRALALKDKAGVEVTIDGFVDFFSFKNNVIETGAFSLKHRDKNVYEVNGHIIDVNFTGEQLPPYDLRPDFIPLLPPKFGIDILGGASGFSSTKPCSSLILNYNSNHMLLDCPPYLDYALKARGISKNQIKSIFLTHIHDDHCNIFPLVLFHEKLKFLCTKEIFWMACKKLSLMTMHDMDEFTTYFDFHELIPNEPNDFYGMNITPHYTVHSIPCIGATFQMRCNGHKKSIVFVGDNKALPEISQMVDEGHVTKEKYENIQRLYHQRFDIFAADGGMGILHGDPRDSLESQSERIVFMHLEGLPEEFNTSFNLASPGKRFTIAEGREEGQVIQAIHIINNLYPGISENWQNSLLNNIEVSKYNAGDVIMKQGNTSRWNAYIILSGNVHILQHDGKKLEEVAINQAGDIIGEIAILNNIRQRSASIVAKTPVMLGEIDGDILYSFLKSEGRIESNLKMLKIRAKLEFLFLNFGLSIMVIQKIASVAELIKVEKDQVIIRQNDTDKEFYMIIGGSFAVSLDGKELEVLKERDVFGEFGGLENKSRNATVVALESGELIQLKKEDFIRFTEEIPSLSFYLNQLMKERKERRTTMFNS